MYDALYDMLGADRVTRLIERNVIEIAPLAFMRGRSLNESFVITSYSIHYTKLYDHYGVGDCGTGKSQYQYLYY